MSLKNKEKFLEKFGKLLTREENLEKEIEELRRDINAFKKIARDS